MRGLSTMIRCMGEGPAMYADNSAASDGPGNHVLDVYFQDNRLVDVRLDGKSLFPVWFKIEFKGESGEVSAKIKGVRLATRYGDEINLHSVSGAAAPAR